MLIPEINELVAQSGKEQFDDDAKKEYSDAQLDRALDHKISNLESLIDDLKESIDTLKSEIERLVRQVSEATESRKVDHFEHVNELVGNTAAKEILKFAMNCPNKFYNSKLYKSLRSVSSPRRSGCGSKPRSATADVAGAGTTVSHRWPSTSVSRMRPRLPRKRTHLQERRVERRRHHDDQVLHQRPGKEHRGGRNHQEG